MKMLLIVAAWVTALASSAPLQANCFWEVSSRLIGFRPANAISAARTWPLVNLETRLQTRTPGGWWSTVNWPIARTNSNGLARIRSSIAFADPVCQLRRDVRVQIRSFSTGGQWRTVHQEGESAHNDHIGIFIPAPIHRVAVGNLVIDGDLEGDGVVFIEGMTEPPVELKPVKNETVPAGTAQAVPEIVNNNNQPDVEDVNIQPNDDPCGPFRLVLNGGVEFRFGQLPTSPDPLSPDQALRVETRTNGSGNMTLNRLTNHIGVENAGNGAFNAVHHCPVEVHVRVKESPVVRPDDGWSSAWIEKLPDIAINQVQPVEIRINLWGSGDDLEGQWDQEYEYLKIEVTLDATNLVSEAAESDNQITHCYHAPTNSFAAMANCEQ